MNDKKGKSRGEGVEAHFETRFLRGIKGTDPILHAGVPQIATIGRSNAGKSSTLNAILGAKVARVSARPGKTTEINIFEVKKDEKHFFLLDFPGYGWSRLRIKEQDKLRKLILWYLTESGMRPKKIVLVIDATIPPSSFDQEAVALAEELGYPLVILANKVDRLNQRERAVQMKILGEAFKATTIIPWSAKTKEGRNEAIANIFG